MKKCGLKMSLSKFGKSLTAKCGPQKYIYYRVFRINLVLLVLYTVKSAFVELFLCCSVDWIFCIKSLLSKCEHVLFTVNTLIYTNELHT
jgi:hypothetical protein